MQTIFTVILSELVTFCAYTKLPICNTIGITASNTTKMWAEVWGGGGGGAGGTCTSNSKYPTPSCLDGGSGGAGGYANGSLRMG